MAHRRLEAPGLLGREPDPLGPDNTPERRRIGPLPQDGQVGAAGSRRRRRSASSRARRSTAGPSPSTAARSTGTRPASSPRTPQDGQPFDTLTAWVRAQKAAERRRPAQADRRTLVKLDRDKRTAEQKKQLRDYFVAARLRRRRGRCFAPLHQQLAAAEQEREAARQADPDHAGLQGDAEAAAGVHAQARRVRPARRRSAAARRRSCRRCRRTLPRNRLGFAQWLVAAGPPADGPRGGQPLLAAVFGTGLVKTAEDFGSQGEPPSHPELLDWLAVEFREDGWDVKKLMKLIVTSATYRQSSKVTPERLAKDPDNRLLSRGPRFRLDAEMLRDQALFVSGLLVEKLGGPSVKPPQPAGLWEAVGYVGSNTAQLHGRHRARQGPPPQPVHVLEAHRPAAADEHLRRPVARGLHRPPRADQHAAAGAAAAERDAVRRGARGLAERAMKQGGTTPEDAARLPVPPGDRAASPTRRRLAELLTAYSDHLATYATRRRRRRRS